MSYKKQAKLVSKKSLENDDYFEFLDFGYTMKGNLGVLIGITNLTNNLISFYYKQGELSRVAGKMKMGNGKVEEVLRKRNLVLCRSSDGSVGVLGLKKQRMLKSSEDG